MEKVVVIESHFNIDAIYRSGQTFSIEQKTPDEYHVYSRDRICVVKQLNGVSKLYVQEKDESYWKSYFNLDVPFNQYLENMLNYGNDFIKRCADYSIGLSILKQDLWETMLSFIISQRKSIPAIKTSLNRLRMFFGKPCKSGITESEVVHFLSLPRPEDLLWCGDLSGTLRDLHAGESEKAKKLLNCGLGYRCEYILYVADWFINLEKNHGIDALYQQDSKTRISELLKVRGIGTKVANCISLFAFNDFNSFPVDVWIQRVIDSGLLPSDLSKYEGYLGYLQQVIFFYVINHKGEF